MHRLTDPPTALLLGLCARLPNADDRERGDIPGWVLITVMTAALVTIIWTAADDQISGLLDGVLDTVAPNGGT